MLVRCIAHTPYTARSGLPLRQRSSRPPGCPRPSRSSRSRGRRDAPRRLAASALKRDEALLGQLADRVSGALTGVARVLDAAVWHLVGTERRHLVDQHTAELQPLAG